VISGDARFSSGGSFSIKSVSGELTNFVSYYDPIISANGNVNVAANYTGASLLVEATGNIRFEGNINITRPDTSGLPAGPDTATLSTSSALIMRSGQSTLDYGGVNAGAFPAYRPGNAPAGITIGGNVTLQPFNGAGGIVDLLAASGDVSTQGMTTNGGAINIDSAGSFTINGQTLDTKNGVNSAGSITINERYPDPPPLRPIQIGPLPRFNQIDTDSLLANSCIVRRNQPTRGSFTITGTGGLPQRPGDAQMSTFPTVDIETLPSDSTPSTTNPNRPWQKGDPIVEPQGVYRLANGKLVLSRECS
jgi:large exoprotein involved in heme utilization and adhesion